MRVAAWAVLGAGLALIGLGAYSSYKVSDVNSKLDPLRRYPCKPDGEVLCTPDGQSRLTPLTNEERNFVQSEQDTGSTFTALQWVGYGVGAAALVTSAFFFVKGYAAKPSAGTASGESSHLLVMPTLGPGSAGAMAYMTF
jgi:hypothetical protein